MDFLKRLGTLSGTKGESGLACFVQSPVSPVLFWISMDSATAQAQVQEALTQPEFQTDSTHGLCDPLPHNCWSPGLVEISLPPQVTLL